MTGPAVPDDGRPECPHCGSGHHEDDVFCERCGYDFITGSLPDESVEAGLVPPGAVGVPPGAVGGSPGAVGGPSQVPQLTIEVAVDVAYFDVVVQGGELDLPEPIPAPSSVEVSGHEVHIGRASESRNIHPDVDVADLTGDPAVSSRHAVVRVNADGSLSIIDVGSTNGTTLTAPSAPMLVADRATPLDVGQPIFMGAWSRLTVRSVESDSAMPN